MFEDTNQTEIMAEETTQQEGLLPFDLFDEEEHLTVKYNGEERHLTRDEAKIFAQKGMNYDHIFAQREGANRTLDAIAAREGITRAQLISQTEGTDISELRWSALLKKYPDLQVKDIPTEVFHAVAEGESPMEAYQAHLIRELNLQIARDENSRKTIGSLHSAGEAQNDDFLSGFYGRKY